MKFLPPKSRYLYYQLKKKCLPIRICDRDTMEWTTKFLRSKPFTRLLLYLSLAGSVCGFSLLNPSVAYGGRDEENSVCGNFGRHKGFRGQRLRMRKIDRVKRRFCKRAWIFLRRKVNYFKNKCGDRTILFGNWVVQTKRKLLVKLKEILWSGFMVTQILRFLAITQNQPMKR